MGIEMKRFGESLCRQCLPRPNSAPEGGCFSVQVIQSPEMQECYNEWF